MTTSDPPPPPVPTPPALRPRNQVFAIIAIVLAAAVPIALAVGVDLCTPLRAVGVELAACADAPAVHTVTVEPESPRAPGDAGVPR